MRRASALLAVVTVLAVLSPAAGALAATDGRPAGVLSFAGGNAPAPAGLHRLAVGRDAPGEREAGAGRHRADPCPGTALTPLAPARPGESRRATSPALRAHPASAELSRPCPPRSPPASA